MKTIFRIVSFILPLAISFAGCTGTTVEKCIVADTQYADIAGISDAQQPASINSGHDAYASVEFTESPKGMAYTVKWYSNAKLVKEEQQAVPDAHSVLVFKLDGSNVAIGSLRAEVLFRDEIIRTQKVEVR